MKNGYIIIKTKVMEEKMENKIVDIDLRIVRTNKMIRRVRQVRAMVKLAMKNMDNQ